MTSIPPVPKPFRYHVLFSYAGKNAEYVQAVLDALPEEVKCFDYKKDPIWGFELKKELERRYTYEALFCVVFISEAYLAKDWTAIELTVVRRVAKRKPGYMLPVLLDGEMPAEIAGIARLDQQTPQQLAERIVARICGPPPKWWWSYVTLEVKIAAAAALLALILFARPTINYFRPSRTSIQSVRANADAIIVHLRNDGPKSATIAGQRLKFGILPIEDAPLRLDAPASATVLPGESDVKMTVTTLEPKCGSDGNRPNNDAIAQRLGRQIVTLEVDVQESNGAPGHPIPKRTPITAADLKPFIGKWVPSRVPPCD